MNKQDIGPKKSLVLKKQKVLALKATNYSEDPTDNTAGTTKTTGTGGLDAIMIAYLTM